MLTTSLNNSNHDLHHTRQLLISCAELLHRSDLPAARRVASLLLSSTSSSSSSPLLMSDSSERIIRHFALALSLRLFPSSPPPPPPHPSQLQSSYLSLNQITPFLRFAHLTANQAILEAVEGSKLIHILDFDTSHGLQWPPLLQAIADRSDPSDLPSVRITGTGSDLSVLRRTAHRLETFALSLGLPFHFHPLLLPSTDFTFQLHPSETLAVNCVMFLRNLMKDPNPFDDEGAHDVRAFLRAVRAMNPAVVTLAEREASFASPIFLQRFMEALEHYTAVFESLEATLPPTSRERLEVEQVWFGREIGDVVAGEGEGRKERSQRFESWEALMRSAGFAARPLSPFALSQARLLLRLHYPSEGYQLKVVRDAFFLGWQSKPLFSVSSWH